MKKFSSHPYFTLILGIILTLIGIKLIINGISYSIPPQYDINAFDAIFIVPAVIKVLYYQVEEACYKFGIPFGIIILCFGVVCIILGIRGILKDDFISYFKRGEFPTDEELQSMLENGEITKEEYNEINEYKNKIK